MDSSASSPDPGPDPAPSAAPAPATHAAPRTLVFRVGDTLYGCAVESVREILRARSETRIPGAPPFVRGLTNLRGEVLIVLDLGMALDGSREALDTSREGARVVVVEVGGRRAGLAVEEVLEVAELEPESGQKAAPQQVSEGARELVDRVGHLDGRIVLVLDVSALVNRALV